MKRALQVILGVGLFGVAFSGTLSYQELASWGLLSGGKVTARKSGQRSAIPSARALPESTAQPGTAS